jgi:hypothetical protein
MIDLILLLSLISTSIIYITCSEFHIGRVSRPQDYMASFTTLPSSVVLRECPEGARAGVSRMYMAY